MKIRPSELGKIMTMAKGKGLSPEVLSVGAKTFCYEKASEFVYGYHKKIKSKYLDKGIEVEDESIKLYNNVFFTNYVKNVERRTNQYLSGECDIVAPDKIIDIKSAWSLDTFPTLSERIDSKDYEWQGRAYMILWDKPLFEIAYCMVSTPEELVGYEDDELHLVDHIDPTLRVTTKSFERCKEKDELIKIKCNAALEQINQYIVQITDEHSA